MSRGYGWAVVRRHVSRHMTQPWIQSQCQQHGDVGSIPANIVGIIMTREDMLPTFPTKDSRSLTASMSVVCFHGWCSGRARESGVFVLCDSCNRFFADIFFYIKYIPRSTAYYFEPQIKNLMIVMSLCWELLMGWRTSRLGLKLLRACRRILLCCLLPGANIVKFCILRKIVF